MPCRPTSAGRTTTWPSIALAAQKRHLSLYVCAVVEGVTWPRPGRPVGHGVLRQELHPLHPPWTVDAGDLGALVHDAVAATAAGSDAYSAT